MARALNFLNKTITESKNRDKTLLWVTGYTSEDGKIGISFNELKNGTNPDFRPPTLEMGEAVGAPVSYAQAECGDENIIANRVYMETNDNGTTWKETGRVPLSQGCFCNIAFPKGRIIGLDVGRINEDRTGWCDYISVKESLDGGNTFTEIKRLLKGCAVYLWRIRRLSDGSFVVLGSLYGTPWGPGKIRSTRNTELPGETYINKIQTFFLHSVDGINYTGPHYILPGTGAHEYDVAELSDGRLLFIAGDVQATPAARQFVKLTDFGVINGPLLPIKKGAPKEPSKNPQGGYIPETFVSVSGDILVGARRNKCYSYSTDYGENWHPLLDLPESPYQPFMLKTREDVILNFGHIGGDISPGMADTQVICHQFNLPKDLPGPVFLSLKRQLREDGQKYINRFKAKLEGTSGPLSGEEITFRVLPFWNEDGSVNTLSQEESPLKFLATTDKEGFATLALSDYDKIRDIHFAYKIDAVYKNNDITVESPLMTVLAMTPERKNPNPYPAYLAENTLFLSPEFINNNENAIEIIENALKDQNLKLPENLAKALVESGVLTGENGNYKWMPATHSKGPTTVLSQGKGDYYV